MAIQELSSKEIAVVSGGGGPGLGGLLGGVVELVGGVLCAVTNLVGGLLKAVGNVLGCLLGGHPKKC
jgi:hypothetical protein